MTKDIVTHMANYIIRYRKLPKHWGTLNVELLVELEAILYDRAVAAYNNTSMYEALDLLSGSALACDEWLLYEKYATEVSTLLTAIEAST